MIFGAYHRITGVTYDEASVHRFGTAVHMYIGTVCDTLPTSGILTSHFAA